MLTNIRNTVARPAAGNLSEATGPFRLTTRLRTGADIEALDVDGVLITANNIPAYPLGSGLVTASSLAVGARVTLRVRFASDSVLPADGAVSVKLPAEIGIGAGAKANASFGGVAEPSVASTVEVGNSIVVLRNGSGAAVYPGQLVVIDLYDVQAPAAAGPTGTYRVAALTADRATIAGGDLAGTVFGRPSAPRNVTLRHCSAQWAPEWVAAVDDPRCVIVAFDPPLLDGGSAITGYAVDVDAASFQFGEINERLTVGASAASGRVSVQTMQQREGVYLYFRVSAVDDGGRRGAYEYAGPIRALSVPGKGRPAAIRAFAANQIYVSWFQPEFTGAVLPSAAILGYRIEFDANGTGFGAGVDPAYTILAPAGATSAVSRVLRPGVYRARVAAANVAGYGEPGEYADAGLASPLVAPVWDEAVTPAEGAVLRIRVGYSATYLVRAVDGDVTDSVAVEVAEDPGLPPRAHVGPPEVSGVSGGLHNAATRRFEMTPDVSQVGLVYRACFLARNTGAEPLGPVVTTLRCVTVRVMAPELSWVPSIAAGDGLTPPEGTAYSVYPGCLLEIPLAANAVWYNAVFDYAAYEVLLNGSQALLSTLPGAKIVVLLSGSTAADAAASAVPTNFTHRAALRYQAGRAMSGRRHRLCARAADEFGMLSTTLCFQLQTGGCKACLRQGQTLAALAAEYGTSWLQLWVTNPRMGNPDRLRQGSVAASVNNSAASGITSGADGQILNLGVHYMAAGGESVASLAERFFTSAAAILAGNPSIVISAGSATAAAAAPLVQGQEVCVVPPLCAVRCSGGGRCKRSTSPSNPGYVA